MATSIGESALRRSALTLHALGEADRRWQLDQFSPARRDALVAMLEELRELGIPPDPELIKAALSPADAGLVDLAAEREARALHRCLAIQPPALQGMLLAVLDLDKRASVLAQGSSELFATPIVADVSHWTEAVRLAVQTSWQDAAKSLGVKEHPL